jgi:hypothetical protein
MRVLGEFGLSTRYLTLRLALSAALMAVIAAVIVYLGRWSDWPWEWSSEHKKFARDAQFVLWLLLILAQLAIAPAVFYVVAETIDEIRKYARVPWRGIVILAVVFGVAAVGVGILGAFEPELKVRGRGEWLPGSEWKIAALSVIVVFIGLAPAIGIWTVQGALRTVAESIGDQDPKKIHLDRLLHLKDALRLFLVLLGALLTIVVIAAAAQRKAVERWGVMAQANFDVDKIFPFEYVLLYGLLFSLLVALVYAPAHLTYVAVARRFRDRIVPLVQPTADNWQTRLQERKSFDELYELQSGTGTNLKASVVALTPLLASLTGLLGD